MIHFMSETRANELRAEGETADLELKLTEGLLAPSEALRVFWQSVIHDSDHWEIVKKEYQQELVGDCCQAGIELLSFYDKSGKNVWVMCECTEATQCVRQLVAEVLAARDVEIFVE